MVAWPEPGAAGPCSCSAPGEGEPAHGSDLASHRKGAAFYLLDRFARRGWSIGRRVGRSAIGAGIVGEELHCEFVDPSVLFEKAESRNAGEPIGARSDHRDERHQRVVAADHEIEGHTCRRSSDAVSRQ